MTATVDNKMILDNLDYEAIADMMDKVRGYVEYEDGENLVCFDYEVEADGYEVAGTWYNPTEYVTTDIRVTVKCEYAYNDEDEVTPVIDENKLSEVLMNRVR